MNRYLTPDEKISEMRMWAESRHLGVINVGDEHGGHGYPDAPIFALCDRLNAIEGICTVQSCAGHRVQAADGSGEHLYCGQLWRRMDEERSAWMLGNAMRLALDPLIEGVALRFQDYGHEVWDVKFRGRERGTLAESSELLSRFFAEVPTDV